MHLGLIGLGKMGGNMRERIRRAGHDVTGYSRSSDTRDVTSLEELVAALPTPRVVWVMVPPGAATDQTITALGDLLAEGDLVVDGGNTKFTDDMVHAQELKAKGVGFVDCGVSGGVWGKDNGYGLMCGGDAQHVEMVMPIFDALRPEGPRDEGFVHAGDIGSGHYVKMVHNGIEYGLMQAYAEGFELLLAKDSVKDVPGSFKAWTRGTVVRSWLLDLMVKALEEDHDLGQIRGYVNDSGEGRWTVEEAIAHAVPMPVITAALFARFSSRQDDSPQMKAVAALRNQFGGHAVTKAGEAGVLTDH
jgi:6-phosphogluconate dehydrogenase